jgi:hypothetical protein
LPEIPAGKNQYSSSARRKITNKKQDTLIKSNLSKFLQKEKEIKIAQGKVKKIPKFILKKVRKILSKYKDRF